MEYMYIPIYTVMTEVITCYKPLGCTFSRFYIVAAGPTAGQGVAVARNLLGSDGTDWLPKDDFLAMHRAGGHEIWVNYYPYIPIHPHTEPYNYIYISG